jgi:hypothetical protein
MFFLNSLFFSLLFYSAEFQRLKGVNTKSALESRELKQQLAKLQEENDVEKKELETAYAGVITNQKGDLAEQRSGPSFLTFVPSYLFSMYCFVLLCFNIF